MDDFTGSRKIEPFYSYRTPSNTCNCNNLPEGPLRPDETCLDDAPCPVLNASEQAHDHRFLEGFYPIEQNNQRWMGRMGIVLIDVPATANYFFIEGFLPDHFLTDEYLAMSVHIENRHLGDIRLDGSGHFIRYLPLQRDLVAAPRRFVRFELSPSYTITPSRVDTSSCDFRELSVLVVSLGVADREERRKEYNTLELSCRMQPYHPYFEGRCTVCGRDTQFVLKDASSVRETLACNYCQSSNRIRQLARGLLNYLRQRGFRASTIDGLSQELDQQEISIYDTDSNSPLSRCLRANKQYITSDYVPGIPLGSLLAERHYCQDLSGLTFRDSSVDVVLSSDVLEHVRLYQPALREVYRVLKPGGAFIFNVPFISSRDDHDTYMDVVDPDDPEKDRPIRPAVYHGDTLSETGSLVYRIYGRKLFRDLEYEGFLVNYERRSLPQLGIYDCELFVCMKPDPMGSRASRLPCNEPDQKNFNPRDARSLYDCKWLNIELSSVCNLHCRWCVLDHEKPPQFLSPDRFEALLKQIAAGELPSLERIDLHNGGESLLHPRIDEVLKRLAVYRPKLKQPIHIAVLSNGTVLKESTLNLLVSGNTVDEIRLSIDGGTPRDFEEIRRGAKWPVVSKNVIRILDGIAKAQSKTTLGIICMVSRGKKTEVSWMDPEFRSVIERAHHLEIRHPHTWDGSVPDLNGLTPDPAVKNKSRACKFLKHNLVVLANGDVTVCCADLNGRGVIGKTDDQNLMDIHRGERHREMIDLWAAGRFAEIPLCSTCEGYYDSDTAPNPDRERSTAATASQTEHRAPDRKENLTGKYHQAHDLIKSGNVGEGIAALESLVESDATHAHAFNDLGFLYLKRGQLVKALHHYERAVALDPDNIEFVKNLADCYYVEMKRTEAAVPLYDKVLSLNHRDIDTLLILGNLRVESGNYREAQDYYLRALEIDPENAMAKQMMEAASKQVAHPSTSLLEEAKKSSGPDEEAMELYRSIYRRFADKSDPASLAAALEQLLARHPEFSAAHNDLGVIAFNHGDVAGAKYHYERAVNQDPANITTLKNLADFYFAAEKQPKRAQTLYHRILADHPDDIETLLAMGHVTNSLGNVADSAVFFRRALDISPEYEIAREIIHALSVPESQESASMREKERPSFGGGL